MVTGRLRVVLVKLHLYIGLTLGLLFVLLGLTGMAIAWRDELDAWLNPDLLVASAPAAGPVTPATVQAVTERLAAPPYGRPNLLMLPTRDFREIIMTHPQLLAYVGDIAEQRRRRYTAITNGSIEYEEGHARLV